MDTDSILALSRLATTLLVGIAGLVLSLAVYRLSTRQREDAWLQHFAAIHDRFWSDDDMKEVRAWFDCQDAYRKVEGVLKKRRDPQAAATITTDEYSELEKLDKFLTLMTRVVSLHPRVKQ